MEVFKYYTHSITKFNIKAKLNSTLKVFCSFLGFKNVNFEAELNIPILGDQNFVNLSYRTRLIIKQLI